MNNNKEELENIARADAEVSAEEIVIPEEVNMGGHDHPIIPSSSDIHELDRIIGSRKLRKQFGIKMTPYTNDLKIGRNDPCPCGSGKKYKKCCLGN